MGTFVVSHWHPCSERSWKDLFCLEATRLIGAGLAYSLSAVTNVLFHTFDPKLRFNYCWMDKMTKQIYIIFFLIYKSQSSNLELSPNGWRTKDIQETKLNNRRAVVKMAARSVFSFYSKFVFSSCFFPASETGTDDISIPLPSLPVWRAE